MCDHCQDRTEDLLTRDPGFVGQPGDHRGFDEEPTIPIGGPAPSAGERPALGDRQVEVGLHSIALARGNHRTTDCSGIERVTGFQTGHGCGRSRDGFVVSGTRYHQSSGDRTALAGVHRRGEGRHGAGSGEIGVIKNQEGRLATQFQEHLLDGGGARRHDRASSRG